MSSKPASEGAMDPSDSKDCPPSSSVMPGDKFRLPPDAHAAPELQETYCQDYNAYPLRGRPFGLALVWGHSYQDDRGDVTLMVAVDR